MESLATANPHRDGFIPIGMMEHWLQIEPDFAKSLHQSPTLSSQEEDAPIVKILNYILQEAIEQKASDIHFEPYSEQYRIRFRLDGVLKEIANFSVNLSARMSVRIKIMAKLDIAERRLPQDGGIALQHTNCSVDLRVSTCPTLYGEKIVIRLLNTDFKNLSIEELGMEATQRQQFLKALQNPQGLILITGPTGSGKTRTLYSALQFLNSCEKNICTIEDPVEIRLSGINQFQVQYKSGLTFAKILRAQLRQDPDIIMLGEVRDQETAEIAIHAAQTGHLVLSTLHTNNAVETLTRLNNLGVPSHNLAGALTLLVAQRLVRCLCEKCKKSDINGYQAFGCPCCFNGYKGRTGLFEIVPITKDIVDRILRNDNSYAVRQYIQQEYPSIYLSGLEKVAQGLTTLTEVQRVSMDW